MQPKSGWVTALRNGSSLSPVLSTTIKTSKRIQHFQCEFFCKAMAMVSKLLSFLIPIFTHPMPTSKLFTWSMVCMPIPTTRSGSLSRRLIEENSCSRRAQFYSKPLVGFLKTLLSIESLWYFTLWFLKQTI